MKIILKNSMQYKNIYEKKIETIIANENSTILKQNLYQDEKFKKNVI